MTQNPTTQEILETKAKGALFQCERLLESITELSTEVGEILSDDGNVLDESGLTDLGFLFREMERVIDRARKDCGAKQRLIGKIICVKVTKRAAIRGAPKAVGKLATATPDIKMRPSLPQKETPEWFSLMSRLGVSQEAQKNQLVKLHWSHISEWLTRLAADGKPAPPELQQTLQPEPGSTYRRKKNK